MSCTNPGNVSSAERAPPRRVAFASQTSTEHPARASVIAAARPFGPDPTITPSYSWATLPIKLLRQCFANLIARLDLKEAFTGSISPWRVSLANHRNLVLEDVMQIYG